MIQFIIKKTEVISGKKRKAQRKLITQIIRIIPAVMMIGFELQEPQKPYRTISMTTGA